MFKKGAEKRILTFLTQSKGFKKFLNPQETLAPEFKVCVGGIALKLGFCSSKCVLTGSLFGDIFKAMKPRKALTAGSLSMDGHIPGTKAIPSV